MSERLDATAFLGLPKLDQPCGRCGWLYKGFHICFDASKPEPGTKTTPPKNPGGFVPHKSTTKVTNRASGTRRSGSAGARRRDTSKDPHIVEAYKNGVGMRGIAKEFAVGYQTVKNIINAEEARTGQKIMRAKGTVSPSGAAAHQEETKERDEKIVSLYKKDLGIVSVAEVLDIHPQTVSNVIRRIEQATGESIMRPAHVNLRWSREEEEDGLAS